MYVTYRPEDGEEQRWKFDPDKVRASKAEMIEKRFGENWDAWKVAVQQGNMRARRVLLWHLLTLAHSGLRFEDTPDFFAGEMLVEHSVDELRDIRDRVEKRAPGGDTRDQVLAALDVEITEAMAREEGAGVEPEGKAPSSGDANATR